MSRSVWQTGLPAEWDDVVENVAHTGCSGNAYIYTCSLRREHSDGFVGVSNEHDNDSVHQSGSDVLCWMFDVRTAPT